MIVQQGFGMIAAGIVLGVGGAMALSRVLTSMLFEVAPTDPVTFVGVSFLLAAVALTACYIPARRATRVDPIIALKAD